MNARLKYLLCGGILCLAAHQSLGQISHFYAPKYATFVPTFDAAKFASLTYTYYLDGNGSIYLGSDNPIVMNLVAHEAYSIQITTNSTYGGGTSTTCAGWSTIRNLTKPDFNVTGAQCSYDVSPRYQYSDGGAQSAYEGPMDGCWESGTDYVTIYGTDPGTPTSTTGLWKDTLISDGFGFTGLANTPATTTYSYSGGTLGTGNSVTGANRYQNLYGLCKPLPGTSGCANSLAKGKAFGTYIVVSVTVTAANYSSRLSQLATDLASIPSLIGAQWGYENGSGDWIALVNPRWNYGNNSFSFELQGIPGSSSTYTLKRSLNNGASWSTVGSYSLGSSTVRQTITDTSSSLATADVGLYQFEDSSGFTVGPAIGFTTFATSYNKFTAHGASLIPTSLNVADIFPTGYSWEVNEWLGTGVGYDYNAYAPGAGWDEPEQVINYMDGFFVKSKTSGAPAPRLCGYALLNNNAAASHMYQLGHLATSFNGSASPAGFSLNSGSGGIKGVSGAIAYKWDVPTQAWSSTTWGTSSWGSNYSYAGSEGLFLYFPSTDYDNWIQSFTTSAYP